MVGPWFPIFQNYKNTIVLSSKISFQNIGGGCSILCHFKNHVPLPFAATFANQPVY